MATIFELPSFRAEGLATKYAFFYFATTTLGAIVYMAGIQQFLLIIHYSRSTAKPPYSIELLFMITVLWIVHRVFDIAFSFTLDSIVAISSSREILVCYTALRQDQYQITYWTRCKCNPRSLWDNMALLFYEVLATWLIFKTVLILTDTMIPWARKKPEDITLQLQIRYLELLSFFQRLYDEPPPPPRNLRPRLGKIRSVSSYDDPSMSQLVSLRRYQDEGVLRTLSWDVIVNKQALNEMKETLGPPGGFGELGFNVAGDKVNFEAMGVGTRFNLTFALEQEGKRRTMNAGSRRKSWMK